MTGEELKAIREARGETQTQFGKHVGRTGSAISYYENGLRTIDTAVVKLVRKLRRKASREPQDEG